MTLSIALPCVNGLVMASDSRVTGGALQSADISQKFLQINRDVGVMTYGLAVPGYRGIRRLADEANESPADNATMSAITQRAQTVFREVRAHFIEEQRREDGSLPAGVEGSVGYVIGGYDGNATAQFRICWLHSSSEFSINEFRGRGPFLGGQWQFADWLYQFLGYPALSVEHGLRVSVMMMLLTGLYVDSVGGPTHIATVTLEEGFTLLHERDVARLTDEVQPYLLRLRTAWQEAWYLGDVANV